MTRSRHTAAELAAAAGPAAARAAGRLRRMIVDRSLDIVWKLLGYDEVSEVREADLYQQIGFHSRPAAGAEAEAIVANIGGAGAPVIIATRNEAVRAQIADLDEDETAIFTSQSIVLIRADGAVEIRSAGGTALALIPLPVLEALRDVLVAWTPAPGDGGAALKTLLNGLIGTTPPYSWPTGTTVIKGE